MSAIDYRNYPGNNSAGASKANIGFNAAGQGRPTTPGGNAVGAGGALPQPRQLLTKLYDHWTFNDTLVGAYNGRTFTAPAPAFTDGKIYQKALSLDATTNTVCDLPSSSQTDLYIGTSYVSVCYWVYFNTLSAQAIVGNLQTSGGSGGFSTRLAGGSAFNLQIGSLSSSTNVVGTTGTWFMVCASAVGDNLRSSRLWVNNNLMREVNSFGSTGPHGSFRIGQRIVGGTVINARIQSLSIWVDHLLSQEDIEWLWNNGQGRPFPFTDPS